jgi:hypothetical protein
MTNDKNDIPAIFCNRVTVCQDDLTRIWFFEGVPWGDTVRAEMRAAVVMSRANAIKLAQLIIRMNEQGTAQEGSVWDGSPHMAKTNS